MLCLLWTVPPVSAQEVSAQSIVGHGVARLEDGNAAAARHRALVDAQQKVIMQAVSSQLSVGDIARHFVILQNLFFSHPEIYLQRFKIVHERALLSVYRVTIQGFVQQEVLEHDLKGLGIGGTDQEALRVLVMVVERGHNQPRETFWWSARAGNAASHMVQEQLEAMFREKGSQVVDPFQTARSIAGNIIGTGPEPDTEAIARLGEHLSADVVVFGKAELNKPARQVPASLESVQCNLKVRAIYVKKASDIVQAATYALGVHVDEPAAAADAVRKACSHIADEIIDKIYLQLRTAHDVVFRVTFKRTVQQDDARRWYDAFERAVSDVKLEKIGPGDDARTWNIAVTSTAMMGSLLHKIYDMKLKGYTVNVVAAHDREIDLMVSPWSNPPAATIE